MDEDEKKVYDDVDDQAGQPLLVPEKWRNRLVGKSAEAEVREEGSSESRITAENSEAQGDGTKTASDDSDSSWVKASPPSRPRSPGRTFTTPSETDSSDGGDGLGQDGVTVDSGE